VRKFSEGDRSGLYAPEKIFFDGLGKFVNVMLAVIQHGADAVVGGGLLDLLFQLHFKLEPPGLKIEFPSAIENFELSYDEAVKHWKKGWDGYWESMFHLGMALHYLGDMAMVNHTFDSNFQNHSQYENYADKKGDLPEFNATNGGKYIQDKEPWEYLYLLASIIHNKDDLKAVARGEFESQLKKAVPLAEQYTAGLMARFFQDVGVDEKGNPVMVYVRSQDGGKIRGAYIFYKEAKTLGNWNYARTDYEGKSEITLIHDAKYWIRPSMPGYIFEGVALDEFHEGNYDVVDYSLYDQRKDFVLKSLKQTKIAEVAPSPQGQESQMDLSIALQKGLPILPENQWVISHGGSSQSNPGFVSDSMAEKINRAVISISPSNYFLGVDRMTTGFPESTLITLQLLLLANNKIGSIIQSPGEVEAVLKMAKTEGTKPESEAAWSNLVSRLPKETLNDASGKNQTAVSLIGGEGIHNGFIEDSPLLLLNGITPVIPKEGIKVEVAIMEQELLAGVNNSVVVTTDEFGRAYVEVKTGSNPGPITLRARVIDNPTALQVEPQTSIQIISQPSIDRVDRDPPTLPTLSTTPFKHAVAVSNKKTADYTVTFEKGEVVRVDKVVGADASLPTIGAWSTIWDSVGTVILGFNPIEKVTQVYATERSSGDIFRYDGRWEKIGDSAAMFVADHTGHLYGLSPDKSGVYEFSGTPGKWNKVGGAASQIYAGGDKLYATNPDSGDLYQYTRSTQKWKKIGGPGAMFATDHKGQIYGLSSDKTGVYKYSGTPGKWTKIGGAASHIYAGGDKLYATNPDTGDIYQYFQNTGKWEKVGGPGKMFAVSFTGQVFGVSPDGKGIYKYSETTGKWNKIGDAASSIAVGEDMIYAKSPETHVLQMRKLSTLDEAPSAFLDKVSTDPSVKVKEVAGYKIGLSGHDYGSGERLLARGDVYDEKARRITGQVFIYSGDKMIGYAKVISGYFKLYDLDPGDYQLRFTSLDSQKHAESNISILPDHTLIKIVLQAR
jgi:hypothetical protein